MDKIGLVTVLYKSDDVLPDFFKSISNQHHSNYILYLIDNDPNEQTDAQILQCQHAYPVTQFRHIKSSGNIGVAAGNNMGIKLALEENCKYLIILNNDIEFEQRDVFGSLLSIYQQKKHPIIVPKIYFYDSRKIWLGGGYMNKWRALGVHEGYNKTDDGSYDTPALITYAPTCFMFVESSVFETVGLMDEKYFAYYDDTDFVFRALHAGYKLYYEPALLVLHKVSSSTGGDSTFYVYYSNRNKIYFIRKHLRGLHLLVSMGLTFLTRLIYYIQYDKVKRKKLVQAISDGFKIPVH